MYDFSKVVVEIDSLQFDQCEQLSVTGLEPGEHQITVFQPKSYFDPVNGKLSTRLIQVYNGPLVLFEDKCTTCVIDKYHQQSIVIK